MSASHAAQLSALKAGARTRRSRKASPYDGRFRYAPGLDGVRALAVCAVFLYHARVLWLPGGFFGVDVFFVLSGYLITSLLLAEHARMGTIDLGRFWRGRARRLLPAALLVIAICVLVVAVFFSGELRRLRMDALTSIFYVNNWHQVLLSRSYFANFGRPSLLEHFWSLAVEEQFYLVWPLVLVAGLALRRRLWVALAALAVAIASAVLMALLYHSGGDPSRVYYGTDTHATPLMLGALLAFAWPFARLTSRVGRWAGPVIDLVGMCGLAGLGLTMFTWHDYDPFVYRGGYALVGLAAMAAIAAAAHPASRVSGALGWQPLRWMGQRSYGIYLWHWPVMALTRPGIDLSWPPVAVIALQAAATVGLAELSYRYVEMPIRRGSLQRKLRTWLDRRGPGQRLGAVATSLAAIAIAVVGVGVLPAPQARSLPHLQASPAASVRVSRVASALAGSRRLAALVPPLWGRRPAGGLASSSSAAPVQGPVLAVGASVMLAAAPALEQRLRARVDAAVGRQPGAIIDRLKAYRNAGALPGAVVVQIGDNGPLWSSDVARLRRVLSGVRRVVLVDVRESTSWEQEVNDELARAVAAWPQATIAHWRAASADPALLYDGAHPDPAGATAYANAVASALGR